MASKNFSNHLSVAKGTLVTTERGLIDIQNLREGDKVLNEDKAFGPVLKVLTHKMSKLGRLTLYGLPTLECSIDSQLYVRDCEIVSDGETVFPRLSWPYWISLPEFNPGKHLILSPYNPHTITPYTYTAKDIPVSVYIDKEGQRWVQGRSVELLKETAPVYAVQLESNKGIAVNHLALK